MTGIYTIKLNGKPERIRFNQYARAELAKYFVPEEELTKIPQLEITRAIIEKANQNLPAVVKHIVYAGILGDSLVYGFEPRLSIEQVGEYVGEADDDELIKIWKAFLGVQSVDIEEKEGEKKKESPTSY